MKNLPYLGSGIGFRPELKPFIFLNRDKIDFIEIIADHYIDVPKSKMEELKMLKEHFTVIPHAINLSLGSAEGLDELYLGKLKKLIDYLQPPYWSEHIAFTQAHGKDIGHLAPLVYNPDFLELLKTNIRFVRERINCPLILENITYHVELPGRVYGDAEFLNRICSETGCGLLLDITNLYINSQNFKFDPFAFLNELRLENVVQLHYVGYEETACQLIDTHSRKTQDVLFNLIEFVLEHASPKGVLLERDDRLEATDEILADLQRVKSTLQRTIAWT